jgi:hypothetical protein
VTFTVTRQRRGARNRDGVCGKRVKGSKGHCDYTAVVGRFTSIAGDGANQFVFTGRLGVRELPVPGSRRRPLAPRQRDGDGQLRYQIARLPAQDSEQLELVIAA